MGILRACLAMLPRLHAEECLVASLTVSLGTGAMAKEDAQRVQRQWREIARPDEPVRRIIAPDGAFESLGIKVVREPRT